jgi:hypothetical protein
MTTEELPSFVSVLSVAQRHNYPVVTTVDKTQASIVY